MRVESARLPMPEKLERRTTAIEFLSGDNPVNSRIHTLSKSIESLYRGSPAPENVHRTAQHILDHIDRLQFAMEDVHDRLLKKKDQPAAEAELLTIRNGWHDLAAEVAGFTNEINGWDTEFARHVQELHAAVTDMAAQADLSINWH